MVCETYPTIAIHFIVQKKAGYAFANPPYKSYQTLYF